MLPAKRLIARDIVADKTGGKTRMTKIAHSVGRGGANLPDDVRVVRMMLAGFVAQAGKPPLSNSPQIDEATMTAIFQFQRQVMRFSAPDTRIDPGGRTLQGLAQYAQRPAGVPAPAAPTAAGQPRLTYAADVASADKIVSDYALSVARRGLSMAGMSAGVITSTLRRPAEQAAIMYRYAHKNLAKQFALYGATGDEVLNVYKANAGKPQATVVALMQSKIEDLMRAGRLVSRHVVSPAVYATRNVFDIGVNSSRAVAGASFDKNGLTAAFRSLERDGYIAKFIDETMKDNSCWHLEIVPNAKAL